MGTISYLRGRVVKPLARAARDRVQRRTLGTLDMGALRRLTPVNAGWGFGRGQPIDRYYIETFLNERKADIRGRVLEIGAPTYARMFGGDAVTNAEVLHAARDAEGVTYVDDLAVGSTLPDARFDCLVLTQTLQLIPEDAAALRTAYRILRPGGVLLVTVPALSRIATREAEIWGDYWRYTPDGLRHRLENAFPNGEVDVVAFGNVLTCTAFLHGLGTADLDEHELREVDDRFPMLVAGRAVRS